MIRGAAYGVAMGLIFVVLANVPLRRAHSLYGAEKLSATVTNPSHLPSRLRSPARVALREAAYWFSMAQQAAVDDGERADAVLGAWDPAAPIGGEEARRRRLATDARGYLGRARLAVERAATLARTLPERRRVIENRRQIDAARNISTG